MPKYSVGDSVRISHHPNNEYVGCEGKISEVTLDSIVDPEVGQPSLQAVYDVRLEEKCVLVPSVPEDSLEGTK